MSADKQLKAYIDRVLRLKEEQDAFGDDIRNVYAEAKAEGYDKTVMGRLVAHLRKVLKLGDGAVAEAESIFDTYLTAYQRASGTPVATHTHEEDFDPLTGEVFEESPRRAAEAVSERTAIQVEANASAEATIEGQPSETVATSSESAGEAAGNAYGLPTNQPEMANEDRNDDAKSVGSAVVAGPSTLAAGKTALISPSEYGAATLGSSEARVQGGIPDTANVGPADVTVVGTESGTVVNSQSDDGVNYESVPPMPMKALDYAHCFPELSKTAYQCLAGDIALNGVLEPIVRHGDVIVDGWSRYNAARSLGIEYPVLRYSGKDVLIDVIGWQRSSREWTPAQERKIAAALAKEIPHRAGNIWAAFNQEPSPMDEGVAE